MRKPIEQTEHLCDSVPKLHAFAAELARKAKSNHVYLLYGELAAGKTEWTKGFLKALNINTGSSPSFALQNEYKSAKGNIYHFDLYRLNSPDEITTSGVWDVLDQEQGIVVIEWASRVHLSDINYSRSVIEIFFSPDRKLRVISYAAFSD